MLVSLGLALCAAWLLFGSHGVQGAVYSDQWAELAKQRFLYQDDLLARITNCFQGDQAFSLPVGCSVANVLYSAFGMHGRLYSIAALTAFAVMVWLFFLVLREARLPRGPAVVASSLLLVFQGADAMRLWPMLGALTMAILFLVALLIGAQACQTPLRARAILLGLAAICLAIAAGAAYQTVVPVTPILIPYLWWISRRWIPALLIGGLATVGALWIGLLRASASERVVSRTPSAVVDHAERVFRGAIDTWTNSYLGFPIPSMWAVGLVVFTGFVAHLLSLQTHLFGRGIKIGWMLLASGAVIVVLGVSAFITTDDYYVPRPNGLDNRMNVASQFGYVLVATAFFIFLAILIGAAIERPRVGLLVGGVLVSIALATSIRSSFTSMGYWDESWSRQLQVLGAINATSPRVRPDEVFFTFGHPLYMPNWLPIFAQAWELDSALKIARNNPSATGYPISGWQCGEGGVGHAPNAGGKVTPVFPYWRVTFVNVATHSSTRPSNLRDCRQVLKAWGQNPTF